MAQLLLYCANGPGWGEPGQTGEKTNMRKLLTVVGAAGSLSFVAGCAEAAKLKACFVLIGPHNDGGWSQQHDMARLAVEKALGDKVETSYVENVPEGPDAERAIERLARGGCGIVF